MVVGRNPASDSCLNHMRPCFLKRLEFSICDVIDANPYGVPKCIETMSIFGVALHYV